MFILFNTHARIQRGGQVVRTPPPPKKKNHKAIGFLSNTGPDPQKNPHTNLPLQHSMFDHYQPASEWRLAGGPMMARF